MNEEIRALQQRLAHLEAIVSGLAAQRPQSSDPLGSTFLAIVKTAGDYTTSSSITLIRTLPSTTGTGAEFVAKLNPQMSPSVSLAASGRVLVTRRRTGFEIVGVWPSAIRDSSSGTATKLLGKDGSGVVRWYDP